MSVKLYLVGSWRTYPPTSFRSVSPVIAVTLTGEVSLLGPISGDGFRAVDLPRKPTRHRACLRSMSGKLYHVGFRGQVSHSTLADANEAHAHDPIGVDLDETLYALDSTTTDLCLALFPWARFRKHKAAVKMHTLLDLHGNIPTFIRITDGTVHDVNILDEFLPEAGAFYVMDRGYIDFERLYVFTNVLGLLRGAHQGEHPAAAALLASGG